MRKRIRSFISIISLLLIFALIVCISFQIEQLLHSNSIKEGIIYYTRLNKDDTECAYEYNFKTRKEKSIKINGYENIYCYEPFENGYIAVGVKKDKLKNFASKKYIEKLYNDNYTEKEIHEIIEEKVNCYDVIFCKNGIKKVLSKEVGFNGFTPVMVGQYVVFGSVTEEIKAYNINNNKCIVLSKTARGQLYKTVGDYYCYNEFKDSIPQIYAFDCSKNNMSPLLICEGEIKINVNNKLVYEQDNQLFEYDFENSVSKKINKNKIKEETFTTSYLGGTNTRNGFFDVYLYELCLGNKNSLSVEPYISLFQRIIIKTKDKKQYIKAKRDGNYYYEPYIYFDGKQYYSLK